NLGTRDLRSRGPGKVSARIACRREGHMPSRRTFVRNAAAMTGMLLVDQRVGRAAAAMQSAPPSKRREVTVAGRRVKTIDVHSHSIVPGVAELVGQTTQNNPALIMGTDRLRQMDEQGIDVEALSINPTWYAADQDVASKLIKLQNGKLAEFCRTHSDRFVGFATVALQHPELA